ncbi:MAG: Rieske (2Fe-2S) protein [Mucilaginibacter sp.]|uniref:Rieske (2Fe-2S) protein n=1 Tax=Mucilaginibacter sp. TaxID=1882438 RepID=UPI0031A35CE5
MKWYKIPGIQITGKPFIAKVKVGRKNICLIGYEERIYALSSVCPHAGADLSEGLCVKGKIVCPYHRYTYDVKTGKGGAGQNDFVETYPVEIRGNEIYVGIISLWDKLRGK